MTSSAPGVPLALPGYAHVYSGKVRDLYAPLDDAGTARVLLWVHQWEHQRA